MNYETLKYVILRKYHSFRNHKEKLIELDNERYRKNGIEFGENSRSFTTILSPEPYLLKFGNNVTISTDVTFITHDNSASKILENASDVFGKIFVDDNSFIGNRAIIMPGVTLGKNTIIGAGSVVTKSFPQGNVVIAGNPAKMISTVEEYASKISEKAVMTHGLSQTDKKKLILNMSSDQLINKKG